MSEAVAHRLDAVRRDKNEWKRRALAAETRLAALRRNLDDQEAWLRGEVTTDDGFAESVGLTVIADARAALGGDQ